MQKIIKETELLETQKKDDEFVQCVSPKLLAENDINR